MINAVLTALGRNLFYHVDKWHKDSANPSPDDDAKVVADVADANLISSQIAVTPELHSVVIDIDIPAALVPSSTFGHSHLYIDTKMTWETYVELLEALAKAGIVESGYINASKARGFTAVRLPWIKKETEVF